jgi:putative flippase GtrA
MAGITFSYMWNYPISFQDNAKMAANIKVPDGL